MKVDSTETTERMELMAGTGAAAKDLSVFVPQLIDLQHALHAGASKSQAREAERLASKYGDSDPRVAEAKARTELMQADGKRLVGDLRHLRSIVETFTTDNVFHGYVVDSNGKPATKCTVRIKGSEKGESSAITDSTGYFRFELGEEGTQPSASRGLNSALVSRIKHFAPDLIEATPEKAPEAAKPAARKRTKATGSSSAAIAEPHEGSGGRLELDVRVFDPKGKLVHVDPVPPQLVSGQSHFRYYVL